MRYSFATLKILKASFTYSRLKDKILEDNSWLIDAAKRDYGYKEGADFSLHHLANGKHVIPSSENDNNVKEADSKLLLKALKYSALSESEKQKFQMSNPGSYIQKLEEILDKYAGELQNVVYIPTIFHDHLRTKSSGPLPPTKHALKQRYDDFMSMSSVIDEVDNMSKSFKGRIDAILRMRKTLRCYGVSDTELASIVDECCDVFKERLKEFREESDEKET